MLLLNRVLTVQPGRSGSHRGRGWEQVTQRAIEALVARGGPLVAILWGRDAQSLVPMLGRVPYVASAHPSPLSARAGFFGSRPFSRANDAPGPPGRQPIDWALPDATLSDATLSTAARHSDARRRRSDAAGRRARDRVRRRAWSRSAIRSRDVLDADAEPDQVAGHLELGAGDRGVGHPAGVLDQRLDAAEGLAQDDHLGPPADLQRGLLATGHA